MLELGKRSYKSNTTTDGGATIHKKPREIFLPSLGTMFDTPTKEQLANAINTSPPITISIQDFPVFTIDNNDSSPQMRTKFLITETSGVFGEGGQSLTQDQIIVIEHYRPVPNLDFSLVLQNTNTRFLNKDVFSKGFEKTGAALLAEMTTGDFASGFTHSLNIETYIKTIVRKKSTAAGDPFGGGWTEIEAVFGAKDINYAPQGIYFKVTANDLIIDPEIVYQFNLHFTRS